MEMLHAVLNLTRKRQFHRLHQPVVTDGRVYYVSVNGTGIRGSTTELETREHK